ncbi:DISCO Interacting Protein 1 [Carabus blaptoides fortunei]
MSYDPRRTPGYGAVNSRTNVRPGIQHNFVSGGQFTQVKPVQQQQQQQGQIRQQQKPPAAVHTQLIPQLAAKQPTLPLPPAPLKSALKKEVKQENSSEQQQSVVKVVQKSELEVMDEEADLKKKPFFRTTKTGKISRKERRGRRNQRLRKILQPKNPLMVLNELVGGHKFTVLEKDKLPTDQYYLEPDMFLASVLIDGVEHVGYGKNKAAAKSAAAEVALKHLILTKLRNVSNKLSNTTTTTSSVAASSSTIVADTGLMECDGDVSMSSAGEADSETGSACPDDEDISWLPIASFAMYKLFSSWDTAGILDEQQVQDVRAPVNTGTPVAKRPAKELPLNPHLMNPVMLLNQMKPGTTYEDVAKEGNSPYTIFTVRTTVDGHEFYGKGGNKKMARKNCAYAACSKLFGLHYSPEEYQPLETMMIQ